MATASIVQLKREILYSIRNSDVLSVATRGVTTVVSETFDGDNSETQFTLANTPVKNIRSISVDATIQKFITDFDFNAETGVITFVTAPPSGTDNIDVSYDYGTTDKIFPDFPQSTLKLNQFPRIAIDIIGGITKEFELGAATNQVQYTVTIVSYDSNLENVDTMQNNIRQWMITNKKNFTLFPIITPTNTGPVLVSPWGEQKIFQRNQDYDILFIFDTI